jgi:cytidylate kinase
MPVITISRAFGSGGSEVAALVATALGWSLVDNAFVDAVARRLGTTPAYVAAVDERVPSLAERIADAFAYGSQEVLSAPVKSPLPPNEERVIMMTCRVIDEAVSHGPVVLVGRGAQAYLGSRADALHALCTAPFAALVERVRQREELTRGEAERLVQDRNKQREQYVRRHWAREWMSPEHYHVCVNTGLLGLEGAGEVIVRVARERLLG